MNFLSYELASNRIKRFYIKARRRFFPRYGHLNWFLIYGAERTGTSLMARMVSTVSMRMVGDWGVGSMLRLTPRYSYIKFDRERALRDISSNILDNARLGEGTKLNLTFKQANIDLEEYNALVQMWGKPKRIIFCYREPAGYMASATKKFPDTPVVELQKRYLRSFITYNCIGGDVFEYSSSLTKRDYLEFLWPYVSLKSVEELRFKNSSISDTDQVCQEMWDVYHSFCKSYDSPEHISA